MRRTFYLGGNTSCRKHIRQHWDVYEKQCKEKNIPMSITCMPPEILAKYNEELKPGPKQTTLDGLVDVLRPKEFSREGLLDAVARFITCDDQVSIIHVYRVVQVGSQRESRLPLRAKQSSGIVWSI